MIFNKWKLRKNCLKLSHKNIPSYPRSYPSYPSNPSYPSYQVISC